MDTRNHLAGLGLIALLTAHFLCFHGHEAKSLLASANPFLIMGVILGLLLSSLYLSLNNLSSLISRTLRVVSALSAAAAYILAFKLNLPWLFLLGTLCISLPMAFFLKIVLAMREKSGLYLGIIFAVSDGVWLGPTLWPQLDQDTFTLVILTTASLLVALSAYLAKPPEESSNPKEEEPNRNSWVTLGYLTAIAFFLFAICSMYDWLFYRMHTDVFKVPNEVKLYGWVLYPLAGHWLDRCKLDMRFPLGCLALIIIAPMLSMVSEETALFWFIYALSLGVKLGACIYFMLTFAQLAQGTGKGLPQGLPYTIPWLVVILTFAMAREFFAFFPGTIPFISSMWICAAGFGIISSRLQYALTLSRLNQKTKPVPTVSCPKDKLAEFSLKYGISRREQDVLNLLAECKDTAAVAKELNISVNTVKTHVRQLLRKTESNNRIELLACFLRETNASAQVEAPQGDGKDGGTTSI